MYITFLRLEQASQTRRLDGSSLTSRRQQQIERQSDRSDLAVRIYLFLRQPDHSLDLAEDSEDETEIASCCRTIGRMA